MSLSLVRDEILPAAFNKDGYQFEECEFDADSVAKDQFQSNVTFITAVLSKNEVKIKLPLVMKFEPFNVRLREFLNSNTQFFNEVFMYSQFLPFLNKCGIVEGVFPKFYHGVGVIGESNSSVVVLEDLRTSGYKLAAEKAHISYEHLSLAMKKLGKFHALSYAAKKAHPQKFRELVHELKETWWGSENSPHTIIRVCFHRAMDPLIEQGKHVEVLRKLLSLIDDNVTKFMRKLITPEEPLAVICHGDFCRNNMFFRYENDKPVDIRFFDIATARYSSPAIDISFILFLNSSPEVRKAHWDDLLATYHQSLSTAVPGTEVPSLEDIRREILQKGIYGFVHCSFFLPMMLYPHSIQSLEFLLDIPPEQMGQDHARIGGEEGTRMLNELVEELVDRGLLSLDHKFLSQQ